MSLSLFCSTNLNKLFWLLLSSVLNKVLLFWLEILFSSLLFWNKLLVVFPNKLDRGLFESSFELIFSSLFLVEYAFVPKSIFLSSIFYFLFSILIELLKIFCFPNKEPLGNIFDWFSLFLSSLKRLESVLFSFFCSSVLLLSLLPNKVFPNILSDLVLLTLLSCSVFDTPNNLLLFFSFSFSWLFPNN